MKLHIHKIPSTKEFILLELQGTVEFDCDSGEVGRLEWVDDKPVLFLGHHKLHGQLVKLTKPFAVLDKKKSEGLKTEYNIISIISKKFVFKNRPEHLLSDGLVGLNAFTRTIR